VNSILVRITCWLHLINHVIYTHIGMKASWLRWSAICICWVCSTQNGYHRPPTEWNL